MTETQLTAFCAMPDTVRLVAQQLVHEAHADVLRKRVKDDVTLVQQQQWADTHPEIWDDICKAQACSLATLIKAVRVVTGEHGVPGWLTPEWVVRHLVCDSIAGMVVRRHRDLYDILNPLGDLFPGADGARLCLATLRRLSALQHQSTLTLIPSDFSHPFPWPSNGYNNSRRYPPWLQPQDLLQEVANVLIFKWPEDSDPSALEPKQWGRRDYSVRQNHAMHRFRMALGSGVCSQLSLDVYWVKSALQGFKRLRPTTEGHCTFADVAKDSSAVKTALADLKSSVWVIGNIMVALRRCERAALDTDRESGGIRRMLNQLTTSVRQAHKNLLFDAWDYEAPRLDSLQRLLAWTRQHVAPEAPLHGGAYGALVCYGGIDQGLRARPGDTIAHCLVTAEFASSVTGFLTIPPLILYQGLRDDPTLPDILCGTERGIKPMRMSYAALWIGRSLATIPEGRALMRATLANPQIPKTGAPFVYQAWQDYLANPQPLYPPPTTTANDLFYRECIKIWLPLDT